MQHRTCGNCGNVLTNEERYCGQCGQLTEKTYVKGYSTILAPPSKPLQSSPKATDIHSSDIPPTQPALPRSKPTQKIPTQSSSTAKRPSMKKKRRLFLTATKWAINHPRFWPIIITIGVILFGFLLLKSLIDEDTYHDSPSYGLQSYCDALKGVPDYDTAYSFLSSKDTGRSSMSKSDFIVRAKQITDPQHGVGDCTVNMINQFGDIAHGTITYTYGNGKQSTQEYEVFRAGYQSWKIETNGWQPTTAPVA